MQQQPPPPQGSGYGGVSPEMVSFGGSSSSTPRAQMLTGGGGSEQAEAASPISSRPPAASINFDELGDDPGDRSGGVSSGNRWPRQETLALLKIRSDMDVAFRDATLKGPLWDEVSRKLGELGYVRSAKKCKEKFENVHKYYKRTKEGRAGRQDGKSYRFFTQLEALQGPSATSGTDGGGASFIPSSASPVMASGTDPTSTAVAATVGNIQFATPVSVGIVGGGGGSGGGAMQRQPFTMYSSGLSMGQTVAGSQAPPAPATGVAPGGIGISFSSDSASSGGSFDSEEDEEEDDDMSEEELERPSVTPAGSGQKRKRGYSSSSKGGGGGKRRMMDFFEGLMKQVMQKQEAMQQRFLEIIEKREQDRLMREEAWKMQEAARLSREHELATQERAMAASRDAAIVSFLQKITGQTIQLPQSQQQPQPQPVYTTTVHHAPVAPPPQAPTIPPSPAPAPTPPPASRQQFQQQLQTTQQQLQQHQVVQHNTEVIRQQMPPPQSTEAIMAVPERQIPPQEPPSTGGSSSSEPASSRWPKVEVLALIKLRSNLENRYQEAGPKGPLWEEISAGMQRLGYNRNSKRCKEKWENINKYFKKVKESNKKRPEDAKTCPYFNELDALYQRKKLTAGSSSSGMGLFQQQQQQPQQAALALDNQPAPTNQLQEVTASIPASTVEASAAHVAPISVGDGSNLVRPPNNGGLPDNIFGDQGSGAGGSRKPEDIMMEQQVRNQLNLDDYVQKMDDEVGDNSIDNNNNAEDDQGDDEDESEENGKMGYKIEFQAGPPSNNKNGGNNEAPSFITMVQ